MQANIHPTYFEETQVKCSCGNTFQTGSTKESIHVEICYKCHPLYTGEKRFVDTLGQVGKFQKKQETARKLKETLPQKKYKGAKKQDHGQKSLRELLGEI